MTVNNKIKATNKKAKHFNVIDIILALILLAIITFLIVIFVPSNFSQSESVSIEYTVELTKVSNAYKNNISVGDNVIDSTSKHQLGKVIVFENDTLYSEFFYNNATGNVEMKKNPDFTNLLVTITADAEFIEGEGYMINGHRIAVGTELFLAFPNFVGSGYCIDIKME